MIAIIFFCMLYKLEYALDTYQVFIFNSKEIFMQFAMSGRYITAVIGSLTKIIDLSNHGLYIISYIIAILCIILSEYVIYKMIKSDIKNKVLQILIPVLIIINPFSIELFLYIEKGIMCFGILMSVLAVQRLIKYFKTKKFSNIIISMLFMLIANFSYQGVVGIFVAIGIVYILKYSKNIKEFFKNNIITGIIYGMPALIDYIIVKLLYSNNRIGGEIIITETLEKIYIKTIEMIQTTYYILPKYLFLGMIVFTFVILIYKVIQNNKNNNCKKGLQNIIIEFGKYFYIILGTLIVTILPQIMQSTDSIWFVSRSTYPFASLYGILILYITLNWKTDIKIESIILTISVILLIIQLQSFIRIEKDRYKLNLEDYNISMQIIDRINQYEVETGKKITKIQIFTDANTRFTYDGIFSTGDINIKAFSTDWSTQAIIGYYLGRTLENVNSDNYNELKNFFSNKDWDYFNQEQVMFYEDTLILCRY